jgi:hypothetical protein
MAFFLNYQIVFFLQKSCKNLDLDARRIGVHLDAVHVPGDLRVGTAFDGGSENGLLPEFDCLK